MPCAARRYPIGVELSGSGASARVWAPGRKVVSVVLRPGQPTSSEHPLTAETNGYFSGLIPASKAGDTYSFRLDAEERLYPDPASRFQPEGPHGPSQIVDPTAFQWTDQSWKGVSHRGHIIYEMHVGTFTPEGTWDAASEKLPHLAATGVTLIEIMPLADFPGDFGWGYDGVNFFAPTRLYGRPDDVRRFVDRAHALGLGVILDVVYNHFGPDGNYLHSFSRDYFTDRYKTDWGQALNYDGDNSAPVREFVKTNASYWISEFHFDGLRLDATQNIYDAAARHVLQEVTSAAREAARPRTIYIVAENEEQRVHHVNSPNDGGFGMDALWNDDLHHTAIVALTGHSEAYFSDYKGTPQEFVSGIKWGFLYQGQWYKWQGKRRGTPSLKTDPACFVSFIENHDQVANSGTAERLVETAAPGKYRTLTAIILLAPQTPMLFQGQEFGSRQPFYYFASHEPALSKLVAKGRREFLAQFPSMASEERQHRVPDPGDRATFERCRLDWSDVDKNPETVALIRDLIQLRKTDPVIAAQTADLDGAVLSTDAFVLRFFAADGLDRLLTVNLGRDLELSPAPEPLLAEPAGCEWNVLWSSEEPRYGGVGSPPMQQNNHWFLPANSAVLFAARLTKET